MPANWNDINRCQIWKLLGVTECNNCDTQVQCWGEESQLPVKDEEVLPLLRELLETRRKNNATEMRIPRM